MRCPSCRQAQLSPDNLDAGLVSSVCPACAGHWLRSAHYHAWRERKADGLAADAPTEVERIVEAADSPAGKRCCECGSFLIRWKVGRGIDFHLDRCGRCGGIWFDCNEWQTLKQHNLHDDVHFVFTQAWQAQVRDEDRQQAEQRWLIEQLGEQDVARLRDVQQWLAQHPRRHVLLAQLGLSAENAE